MLIVILNYKFHHFLLFLISCNTDCLWYYEIYPKHGLGLVNDTLDETHLDSNGFLYLNLDKLIQSGNACIIV